jgi:O-antigen/teichoic acid export membrane protein
VKTADDVAFRSVLHLELENASVPESLRLPGLSLSRNFIWTLGGNAVFAGCQWVVVVLLAKVGSAEMVGQFAIATAVAFPITLLANLQLRSVFVTDLKGQYELGHILGLRLVLGLMSLVVIWVVCVFAGYGGKTTSIVLTIGLAQVVDCFSETYYGLFQRHECMDRISRSLMLRSALSFAALATAVFYTGSLLWGVAGFVLGRSVVLLGYDAASGSFGPAGINANSKGIAAASPGFFALMRPKWDLQKQLHLVWVALPLGAVAILNSFNGYVPRYVVEHYMGPHELGIYSALNYIPAAELMVATATGYAAFARLSKLYFTGDLSGFRVLLTKAAAICAGLGVFGLLVSGAIGGRVLAFLYRPEYAERADLLVWLMGVGAVGCLTSLLGCAMTSTLQFRAQLVLFVIVTASSVAACFLLIPRKGLQGAALAALVSMSIQFLGTAAVIHRGLVKRARQLSGNFSERLDPAFEPQL